MTRIGFVARVMTIAAGLTALPYALQLSHGEPTLRPNTAACQGGTCCNDPEGTCYPNGCANPFCSDEKKYWRNDGKACSDPVEEM